MSVPVIHWSRDTPVVPAQLVTAALAMAGPITYGVATGHLAHASFAALGAMATTTPARPTPDFVHPSRRREAFSYAIRAQSGVGLVVTASVLVGVWLAGRGWAGAAGVVGLAAVAAVGGGFNRWM